MTLRRVLPLLALGALAGCDSDSDRPVQQPTTVIPPPVVAAPATTTYQATIFNLTAGQPLSPPTVLMTLPEFRAWSNGAAATLALERLAEAGDPGGFADNDLVLTQETASGLVGPGQSVTVSIEVEDDGTDRSLTVGTMLVNTNDGFTGITGVPVGSLAAAESRTWMVRAYDAGTEANDEVAVPGQGGEEFNESREGDVNHVHVHPGVLTEHDLEGSLLGSNHRFDNPVARITVSRAAG